MNDFPKISLRPSQRYNPEVKKLQRALVSKGYMTQAEMNTGAGYYGPKTKAAVAKLQKALGVNTAGYAGYYGPKTMAALRKPLPVQNLTAPPTNPKYIQSPTNPNASIPNPYYSPTPKNTQKPNNQPNYVQSPTNPNASIPNPSYTPSEPIKRNLPTQNIAQGVAGIAQRTKEIGQSVNTFTKAKQAGMEVTPTTTVTAAEKYLKNPPVLPKTTGTQHIDTATTGLEADLETKRQAVEKEYQDRLKTVQDQVAKSEADIEKLKTTQKGVLEKNIEPLLTPFREAKEKAERERLDIEKNYFANQKTIDEMKTLLTQAKSEIEAASAVTGLRAIREPRINKLKEDMAGRLGVLQAVVAARNKQISMGEQLIDRTLGAIQADRQDQLNYYNNLYKFYESQKDEEGKKLFTLKKDEKQFLDAQTSLIENDMAKAQQSADYIKKLMINPQYADILERAGVKLTDSVDGINQKLAQDAYTQEVIEGSNKMATQGWQEIPEAQLYNKPANEVVQLKDSQGNTHYYWKEGGETNTGESTSSTDESKIVNKFTTDLVDRKTLDLAGTREQFIRQLQAKYPQIDPDDIARKVYETYPDNYEK